MFYSSNLVHLEDSLFAICFMQPPGPSLSTTTSALKAERIPSVWSTLVSQARTFSVRQQRFQAALISGSQRLDCLAWITVIELTSCIILYRNRMSMQLGHSSVRWGEQQWLWMTVSGRLNKLTTAKRFGWDKEPGSCQNPLAIAITMQGQTQLWFIYVNVRAVSIFFRTDLYFNIRHNDSMF